MDLYSKNLEVLGKKPTPAGALYRPLFFILLQIPTPTLHSWRPSISPSKRGTHCFPFSFSPCHFASHRQASTRPRSAAASFSLPVPGEPRWLEQLTAELLDGCCWEVHRSSADSPSTRACRANRINGGSCHNRARRTHVKSMAR
jgi:hypothetical protein